MTEGPITPAHLIPALEAHAARRGFAAGWRAGLDPQRWQQRGRRLLRRHALPDLPNPPVTAQLMAQHLLPCGGLHQQLRLDYGSGILTEAYLLLPPGPGPFPAVLALHDHGSEFRIGKEKCVAPVTADELATTWHHRFFGGEAPGQRLLAQGFAVLAVDATGWGSRACHGYDTQQALAANLMQIGLTPAGLIAWEDSRAAAFLAGHPAVDAGRIASFGFSFGAFRAWQVAALVPDLAACVAVGWMASGPALLVPGNNQIRGQSAFWMIHPGLSRHLDLPDIAALVAPRPLWAEVGLQDALFPEPAVDVAFGRLRAVWQAQGADCLALHRPDLGHSFPPARQAAAFDWLARALREPLADSRGAR